MQEQLSEEGKVLNKEVLSRIYSPIGLDVGAETPDEIALSIVAEIQAVFAGKTASFLRQKPGFIHERNQQLTSVADRMD
jgi:xanthine/CO dehydrogenase XdhC/CoxF family maturation factor